MGVNTSNTSQVNDHGEISDLLDFSKCCTCAGDDFHVRQVTRSRNHKYFSDQTQNLRGDSAISTTDLGFNDTGFQAANKHQPDYAHEASHAECKTSKSAASPATRAAAHQRSPILKLLPGWTAADHTRMTHALESIPRPFSRKHCNRQDPEFKVWMAKISQRVPGKTADDCAILYLHLQSSRVAYFGCTPHLQSAHQR